MPNPMFIPMSARVGAFRRLIAYAIDTLCMLPFVWMATREAVTNPDAVPAALFVPVLPILVEAFTGMTVGRRLLALEVRDAFGGAPETRTLVFRALLKHSAYLGPMASMISGLSGFDGAGHMVGVSGGLGVLMVLTAKRQTLLDMMLGTAVFRVRDIHAAAAEAAAGPPSPSSPVVAPVSRSLAA